jgi:serine/threonine-protein kinase
VNDLSDGVDPALIQRTLASLKWREHRVGLLLFAFGMALTLTSFTTLRGRARELRRVEFERQANQIAAAFRARLDLPLEVLHSISGLFDASNSVTRKEFHAFVANALERHPGIRALEWIPVVKQAERAECVARARSEGLRDFEFKQVGEKLELVVADTRPDYLPILYMEPPDERALGFDVASDQQRRAPTDRARERRGPVVSERIRLVEDPPSVYSIAVFLPVYARSRSDAAISGGVTAAGGAVTASIPSGTTLGFATAVFRLRGVVEPVIKEAAAHDVRLALADPAAGAATELLFESTPDLLAQAPNPAQLRYETSFPYVDRTWKLVFTSDPAAGNGSDSPWMVLLLGTVVSLLLGAAHSALKVILTLRRQVRDALRLGQYTLIEKLGEGGMGVVYRGKHALLRRPTAIKLLPPTRSNAQQIARFEREVQLTSRLAHPNTIAIYDYGRTPDGLFYYAMEYIDGITLEDLVEVEGPLPVGRIVRILEQVLGALAEAHELGLIHRDIKPANIMLTKRGGIADFVKVLDFGLAKESDSEDAGNLSRAMPVLGTPLYLAPEAITSGEVDARVDLYALGAVAYFLATGVTVFEAPSVVEVCAKHLYSEPVPPSQRSPQPIPAAFEAIVLRCLEKKPEQRPQSALQLLRMLSELEVEPYGDEQANEFWNQRGPALVESIARRQRTVLESEAKNATMAVDPQQRELPSARVLRV